MQQHETTEQKQAIETIAENLKFDMTFGRPENELTHGVSMYILGVQKMANAVIEMLNREVE